MTETFDQMQQRALSDPEGFWAEAAKAIDWYKPADQVLGSESEFPRRWFVGAEVNTCYNALDRHVENGRGDQAAIIYDSPITGAKATLTYAEMLDKTARFAGVLAGLGVTKGDRVVIYMPMIAETAVAMLACARLGAIHSVVFGGFAANELAVRIDDSEAKVVVAASCGIEPGRVIPYKPLLDGAIDAASHKPDHCVIFQREQATAEMQPGRDLDWAEAMSTAEPAPCTPVAATDPLYVLYTSGTTGQPKGVVRDNGGHLVALAWSMEHIYGMEPGETYWAASDVGWVVGHSYIVYAPLIYGCASVLFEGKPVGTPDAGVFWRVIEEHDVKLLFTAPTAFRAIRRDDPDGKLLKQYDLSGLRALYLAGERSDPATLEWAEAQLGVPVVDHWWQTETGWPICSNCLGYDLLEIKHGSPARPVAGYDLRVLDEGGNEVAAGEIGALVIKSPLPPGTFPTLWNAHDRYMSAYFTNFPGYYETADAGYIDEDGYIFVMARTDDIINVAGHRLSTGGMEEVLADHKDVAECAVVGVADQLKGQTPVGFLVLSSGVNRPHADIQTECVAMVRERIGPVAAFKSAIVVERLPKTRSGKVLRGTMQKIADSQTFKMPATIDDPEILAEIEDALKLAGYAKD